MANAEATAPPNGAPPPESLTPVEPTLPVDTFREAVPFLRRPFTTAAVKFKVQAAFPKDKPDTGLVVTYIDARLVIERLNMVVAELWHPRYEEAEGNSMWCYLTIDGIQRPDVGEGVGKGLVSDSLKRAAVQFGVGVSLYALPKIILKSSDGHVKQKTIGGKPTVVLTPAGEERCRAIYDMWLDAKGRQAFGDPLDHGDALDAAGDVETEGPPDGVDPETGEVIPQLDPGRATQIISGIKALKLPYGAINVLLGSIGADGLHANTPEGVEARIAGLSETQADAIEVELEKMAQDADAIAPDENGGTDADA